MTADSAHSGRFETALAPLRIAIQIARRPALAKGFALLPKRWRVDQTFGTGRLCQRLVVDHDMLSQVAESMTHLAPTMRFLRALMA